MVEKLLFPDLIQERGLPVYLTHEVNYSLLFVSSFSLDFCFYLRKIQYTVSLESISRILTKHIDNFFQCYCLSVPCLVDTEIMETVLGSTLKLYLPLQGEREVSPMT